MEDPDKQNGNPDNPWEVHHVTDFSFYCCPECSFRCKAINPFQDHAVEQHPQSKKFFDEPENVTKMCEASVQTDNAEAEVKPGTRNSVTATGGKFVIVNMNQTVKQEVSEDSIFIRTNDDNIDSVVSKIATSSKKHEPASDIDDDTMSDDYFTEDFLDDVKMEDDEDPDFEPMIPATNSTRAKTRKTVQIKKKKAPAKPLEKIHQCKHCPEKYGKLYGLAMHMLCIHNVGKDGEHPCPCCHFIANKMGQLRKHIEDYHENPEGNPPPLPNPLPPKQEPPPKIHPEQAESVPLHRCSQCQEQIKGMINLVKHLAKTHKIGTHGHRICPGCSFTSNSLKKLVIHINRTHEKDMVVCPKCNKEVTRNGLRAHIKSHELVASNEVFKCPLESCPYVTSAKLYLDAHVKRNHTPNVRKEQCEACGKTFMCKAELRYHTEKAHLKIRPYVCDKCGKGFSFQHRLHAHMKQPKCDIMESLDEGEYQCDLCIEKFPKLASYIRHYRRCHKSFPRNIDHSKLILYYCDQCTDVYTTTSGLLKHKKKIHQGIAMKPKPTRKEPCPHCGKMINRGYQYTEHIKTVHENDRPYKCTECSKAFGTEHCMRNHILQVHRRMKCKICDKEICSKFWYKRHMSKVHGVVPEDSHQCDFCTAVFDTVKAKAAHMKKQHS